MQVGIVRSCCLNVAYFNGENSSSLAIAKLSLNVRARLILKVWFSMTLALFFVELCGDINLI